MCSRKGLVTKSLKVFVVIDIVLRSFRKFALFAIMFLKQNCTSNTQYHHMYICSEANRDLYYLKKEEDKKLLSNYHIYVQKYNQIYTYML